MNIVFPRPDTALQGLRMTIYNIYVFSKDGACIFHHEWNKKKGTGMAKEEEYKLMYGMVYSIKSFASRMSPNSYKDGFLGYKTSTYYLHCLETPSGVKMVLNTDPSPPPNVHAHLQHIYSHVYVQHAVKNPLVQLNQWIDSELFMSELDKYVRGLPYFA